MSFRDAHALDWGGVYKQTNTQTLISNPSFLISPSFSSLVLASSIRFPPTTLMDSNHTSQINHISIQFGQNVLDLGTFRKESVRNVLLLWLFEGNRLRWFDLNISPWNQSKRFNFNYFLTKVVWNDSIWILFVWNASIWILFEENLFEVFQTWCFLKNTV